MRSLISTLDLSRDEVTEIMRTARRMKEGEVPELKGDVVLFFLEPSTRTRLSFERASREMGLSVYTVTGSESSTVKGESFFDTLKTFEALGFRAVVFRVPFVFFPYEETVRSLRLSLINAGDGTHQHPTQGLTDLFTLMEKFDRLEGLKVLYVGDVAHSRVFRSGLPLMKMFGAQVSVCGPRTMVPEGIRAMGVEKVFDRLDEALEWADVVIWLRIQRERQRKKLIPSEESYFRCYGLTVERYGRLKGFFMHPGPVNRGVDVDGFLVYSEKSLVYEQVRNGLFVRMAVLFWCLRDE